MKLRRSLLRSLAILAATCATSASVPPAIAAGPTILFDGPESLFNDIDNRDSSAAGHLLRAGTYQWEYKIDRDSARFDGRLTLQFSPVLGRGVGEPGPIFLFWSLGGCVDTDPKFEGCTPIFDEQIRAEVRMPTCLPEGACAAGFLLTDSVARQLHAAAKASRTEPNYGGTHIEFRYTAVRTFAGGAYQVMPPWTDVGGDFGELPFAGYFYGNNFNYVAFGPRHQPRIAPGEFHYLRALHRALRTFDPTSPSPGFYPRIAVFTGNWPRPSPTTPDPRYAPCNEMAFCGPPLPATSTGIRPASPATLLGILFLTFAAVLGVVSSFRRERHS